jgi:leishmanolysin-like peptidase
MASLATEGSPRISPMTLALFEDSGWYTPDYNMASRYSYGRDWGYKQGCAFTTDKCLNNVTHESLGTPDHFCNDGTTEAPFCTLDR